MNGQPSSWLGRAAAPVVAMLLAPTDTIVAQNRPNPDSLPHDARRGSAAWTPQLLGTQIDVIAQRLRSFPSRYAGSNSLDARGDHALSHAYGAYVGVRPYERREGSRQVTADAYLDVEMTRGAGISRTVGLAGITNGDVIRQGSADLGSGPYVARAFVRLVAGLGGNGSDTLARGIDQMPAIASRRRLELTLGKYGVSDLFDANRYANSTRTQFMNWGLFQNTAWDFAADTRGYSNGVAAAWVERNWTLRAGSFQMPRKANGNVFDSSLDRARGDNIELTLSPHVASFGDRSPVVRLLAFDNHARMGSYAEASALARSRHTTPDIVADDQPGRAKWGWGINAEQPLADGGETGLFARYGWSDGRNESFVFTEAEQHLSAGMQVAGTRWQRQDDRFALAVVRHGLSTPHREYLALGGRGFLLGDGGLDYGHETIVEGYYRVQIGPFLQFTPDVQRLANPGYNRSRGPATVMSLRLNFRY